MALDAATSSALSDTPCRTVEQPLGVAGAAYPTEEV